jgi:hypothetical protein
MPPAIIPSPAFCHLQNNAEEDERCVKRIFSL